MSRSLCSVVSMHRALVQAFLRHAAIAPFEEMR